MRERESETLQILKFPSPSPLLFYVLSRLRFLTQCIKAFPPTSPFRSSACLFQKKRAKGALVDHFHFLLLPPLLFKTSVSIHFRSMAHGGSTTAVIVIALLSLALAAQGWPCSWVSHQVSLPSENRQDGHVYTVAKQLTVNWTASDSNCSLNGKPTASRSWVLSSSNISCESKRIGHAECTIIVLQGKADQRKPTAE